MAAALSKADLDAFFVALSERLPCATKLVLTGGGEAMLLGGSRPTADVDFALRVPTRFSRHWSEVEAAVKAAAAEAGVTVQYSEDIDRWSPISIPQRRRKTRPWRSLPRLSVHLLDPACWAVYKLARYLDSDVEDLKAVLRKQRVPCLPLVRLCGQALRSSPRSPLLFAFRRQVEHFLRDHGSGIWGRGFDSEKAIATFRMAGGIGGKRDVVTSRGS